MTRKAKRLYWLALTPVLMLLGALSTGAWAAVDEAGQRSQMNLSPGVTKIGHEIYDLHMFVIWVCVVIGVVVFGLMFYSVLVHRKDNGAVADQFHESTKLEIAWTVVPFLILIAMAVPATNTLLDVYNTDDAEMDIVITGYQWKWKYEYLDANGDNISFFSTLATPQAEIYNQAPKSENYLLEVDEPVYLPVNTKVRFLVTANDVLHAWWVPALAVKKDAIPGFINEAWTLATETGTYRGQCAELCGKDHGFMPIVVKVVEKPEYDQWLAGKKAEAAEMKTLMQQDFSLDELVARGKDVYTRSCLACHGANGEGGVGKKIAGSPIATGEISGHLQAVVNGVPGTMMQAFGGQLNEVDLAAVITYQRNAFGNNMGDQVSPVEIYQFKQGQ